MRRDAAFRRRAGAGPGAVPAGAWLAVAVLALAAAPAGAQLMPDTLRAPRVRIVRGVTGAIEAVTAGPLLPDMGAREAAAASQHPWKPLGPALEARLSEARFLRTGGQLEQARAALAPALAAEPHHPLLLTEQGRQLLTLQDYAALERLARAERAAQKDSLLLARELALACERLGRPREAAGVCLEAWLASPESGAWAADEITRLAAADPRGVRELMRRALEQRPRRGDLQLGKAMLDWRAGDGTAGLEMLRRDDLPAGQRPPLRWGFADQLLKGGAPRDSGGAAAALTDLAADARLTPAWRLSAARRAWEIQQARGAEAEAAPALAHALKGVPAAQWGAEFMVDLARGLREAGLTGEARALLRSGGASPVAVPQLALEEALADLHDGPPGKVLPRLRQLADASPEGRWRYAEALFWDGQTDSALACYQKVAEEEDSPFRGAALERAYLIEEGEPRAALPAFGRIAYESWRGERDGARALTDSLYASLPRGTLWAQAALMLGEQRAAQGDARGALAPWLALADSLPEDRLAPLARQRAGDLYLDRLKDERAALAQYEECLARYPRAWNAPEVRRRAEILRRRRS